MRSVLFTRTAERHLAAEYAYSLEHFGEAAVARLDAALAQLWASISAFPQAGRALRPGRYRRVLPRLGLIVLYRWGGGGEDPTVVAVYGRQNVTETLQERWFRQAERGRRRPSRPARPGAPRR